MKTIQTQRQRQLQVAQNGIKLHFQYLSTPGLGNHFGYSEYQSEYF